MSSSDEEEHNSSSSSTDTSGSDSDTGSSSSGSGSDSDSSTGSSDTGSESSVAEGAAKTRTSQWNRDFSSDDSDDEEGRVVLTKEQKFHEALKKLNDEVEQAYKKGDWSLASDKLQDLKKHMKKWKLKKDVPKQFIRVVADMSDYTSNMTKAEVRGLSRNKAKSLVRCTRILKSMAQDYSNEFKHYADNKTAYLTEDAEEPEDVVEESTESSEESDFSSDDEEFSGRKWKFFIKKNKKKKTEAPTSATAASTVTQKPKKKKEKEEKKLEVDVKPIQSLEEAEKMLTEILLQRGRRNVAKEHVLKQLEDLSMCLARFEDEPNGPSFRIRVMMCVLIAYTDLSPSARKAMSVKMWIRAVRACLKFMEYVNSHGKILVFANVKQSDLSRKAGEGGALPIVCVSGSFGMIVAKLNSEWSKALKTTEPSNIEYLRILGFEGLLLSLAEITQRYYIDSVKKFFKSPETRDVVVSSVLAFVKDKKRKVQDCEEHFLLQDMPSRVQDVESTVDAALRKHEDGSFDIASKMALMRIEHLYCKTSEIGEMLHQSQERRIRFGDSAHPSSLSRKPSSSSSVAQKDPCVAHPGAFAGSIYETKTTSLDINRVVPELCQFLYRSASTDAFLAQATLFEVYHHAIHDRFDQARDLILMTRVQDHVGQLDDASQILYNRTLVQIGLCAFRCGEWRKTVECLDDLCFNRSLRELLGQGTSYVRNWQDKSREQDLQERLRMLPIHMHVKIELIEAANYVSAMLLEIPQMASSDSIKEKYRISRNFREQLWRFTKKRTPPESVKERVMHASSELSKGNWRTCRDVVLGLDVWNVWNGRGLDQLKASVSEKIKEVALRTYMLTFNSHYDAMGTAEICEMFELDPKNEQDRVFVRRAVNSLIMNREVQGGWDETDEYVNLHKNEPTYLQQLAVDFSRKTEKFVENNERMLDAHTGNYSSSYKRNDRRGGRGRGRGRGGRRNYGRGRGGGRTRGRGRGGMRTRGRGRRRY